MSAPTTSLTPPPPPSTAKPPARSRSSNLLSSSSRASPLSSHLQMIELKNRILTSLNKLSDRDTHQIAIEDLDKISHSLSPDSIPMFLNCLYDAAADSQQKPIVRKHSIKLLAALSLTHPEPLSSHLPKIVVHIVKWLKDPDSGVREVCQSAVGVLAEQYLKEGELHNNGLVVGLMVKPFLDALSERNKTVQAGSAMCLARLVECARDPPVAAFQKLCPRVCKFLSNPNFLSKAALLSLVSSLAKVGAIASQSVPVLMQCIHECLESSDWSTRKAAADVLSHLASHLGHLVSDGGTSTITALEACRFDKVKPVRDSMAEALQLWKIVAGNPEETKAVPHEGKNPDSKEPLEKADSQASSPTGGKLNSCMEDSSKASFADSLSKIQMKLVSDKTVGLLKKKPPILNNKELNPEFFQKLESWGPGDLPVEVVVPQKCLQPSQPQSKEGPQANSANNMIRGQNTMMPCADASDYSNNDKEREFSKGQLAEDVARGGWLEQGTFRGKDLRLKDFEYNDKSEDIQKELKIENNQKVLSGSQIVFSRTDSVMDNSLSKGNWLGIQRQLAQLERQQANILNMLQDFMGGSHDSMVTLENRVHGLERVIEEMACDLALASGRRGSNFMVGFEGSSIRPLGKCNGRSDYASSKMGMSGDGRTFSDRFPPDSDLLGAWGRDLSRRPDATDAWNSYAYDSSGSGHLTSKKTINGATNDARLLKTENDVHQITSKRGWAKEPGSIRLGEGPSARSVWQASKDEATLEAIRVAGEDNGISQMIPQVAVPELIAEAVADNTSGQERGPIWKAWSEAMDSLHAGDVDSAYACVLSAGDDLLLMKLMDISGPVLDQLSSEIATEVLHTLAEFLQEQSLLDIGFSWIQQLVDLVVENGADFLGISLECKKAILSSLHDASTVDLPDHWEGVPADELILQLAASWQIDLQQLER